MSDVLVIDWGAIDAPRTRALSAAADAMAALLGLNVRRARLPDRDGTARDVESVLAEIDDGAVLLVMAGSADADAPTWQVVTSASRPALLVPPGLERVPRTIERALVPLDGTPESAEAVHETVALLADAGVSLVVLHVLVPQTVPPYWDHEAHAQRAWQDEFLARFCAMPDVQMRLRSGVPSDDVLQVAREENVDLVALGWSQNLDLGRASIVRRATAQAPVPVLLLPLTGGAQDLGPYTADHATDGIRT